MCCRTGNCDDTVSNSISTMANLCVFLLLISFGVYPVLSDSRIRELKCKVCTSIIDEIQKNISRVDVTRKINVGGFRLDNEGNYDEKVVPYWKSEIYLTEMLDDICNVMENYVRATHKANGSQTIISLLADGGMNPLMSEVDLVQDTDLNKSLKYHCEDIVDEYLETLMDELRAERQNLSAKICGEVAQLCDQEVIEHPADEL